MNLLKNLTLSEPASREYFTIGVVALFNVVTFTFFHLYVQALGMLAIGLSNCWLGRRAKRRKNELRPAQLQESLEIPAP